MELEIYRQILLSDVKQGIFGEHMIIESKNDGPLTLILEIR